jgi:ubiquinone/menaquinone biosynthesis C-methylase UbiE
VKIITDSVERHRFIFDVISPVYASLDKIVKKGHRKAIENVLSVVDLKGKTVLDVGTGAAAWGALFMENGAQVHGVDFAKRMVKQAQKLYGDKMTFSKANAMDLHQFEDNSFDIVTASFVLHGFSYEKRNRILKEMHRVTKNLIVVNDYFGPTPALGRFLEFMEGSDYKNFKKNFVQELKALFPEMMACKADSGQAVYFAAKEKDFFTGRKCVKQQLA